MVTGDTKVVESGHGDGVYLNTAGVGLVPDGVDIRPDRAEPGDVVIVSGDIGVHGVAIMSVREGLEFGTEIESDCRPLNGLVAAMLAAYQDIHVLRDPTRGGVATSLNEIAETSKVGVKLDERSLPIPEVVANACSFLGLDPLQVANEGKLLAFVPRDVAEVVLAAMHAHPPGSARGSSASASRTIPGWCRRRRASARPGWWTCRSASSCRGSVDEVPGPLDGLDDLSPTPWCADRADTGARRIEAGEVLIRLHVVAHSRASIYDVARRRVRRAARDRPRCSTSPSTTSSAHGHDEVAMTTTLPLRHLHRRRSTSSAPTAT